MELGFESRTICSLSGLCVFTQTHSPCLGSSVYRWKVVVLKVVCFQEEGAHSLASANTGAPAYQAPLTCRARSEGAAFLPRHMPAALPVGAAALCPPDTQAGH